MRSAHYEALKESAEVTLSGRQLFYLFVGGAVVASLVFVLGVMVGKRMEAADAPHAAYSDDPLAALDELYVAGETLAFQDALTGGPEARARPLGAVDSQVAAAARAGSDRDESAVEGERAPEPEPEEAAEPQAEEAAEPQAEEVAEPQAEEAAEPQAEEAAEPQAEEVAEPQAEEVAEPQAEEAAEIVDAAADETPDEPRFTLQLSSFQSRAEADSFYNELREAGYQPYMVEADVPDKGGVWYRIRLGHYASYDDALEAKESFEAERQIIAYVTPL